MSLLFWILAALMLAITLLIILPPLLRESKPKVIERDKLNAAIYADQLAELEADLRNETLSVDQFEQGRRDLERNLLADVSTEQEKAAQAALSGAGRTTAAVVGIAVPLLAIGIYLQIGQGAAVLSAQTAAGAGGAQADMMAATGGMTPEMMVQRLSERLKTNPDDGMGWAMLGRSYTVLGRFSQASEAYGKALPLMGEDAQLLADYAEVLALSSADQHLTGKPTELFEKALKLDPKNQKALWLAGMAAFQSENYNGATSYWKQLATSMPEDSENAQAVKKHIAEAESRAASSRKN